MVNNSRESDIRVLSKMDVRCSIFKLLLFQMLVAWCGAKHIDAFRVEIPADVDAEVQDSIRSLVHNGIYSHRHLDPSQVQVVVPLRVSRDGELVSRTLEHGHAHGHARARRDLHLRDHQLDHVLHYNLTVDGRDLRLDLRPSVTFITPAMMVERHTTSGRTRHRPDPRATACHYTGSVRGQPASSIALSACDGLAGLLRTEQGEYWIEPSDQALDNSLEGRPHVIFRRSAVDKVAAWHRTKRAVNNRAHNNTPYRGNHNNRTREYSRYANRNRDSKEQIDRRRREQLLARKRRLDELRLKNPKEYRRQQLLRQQQLRLQLEQRRLQANPATSTSASNSVEASKSLETNKRNKSKLSKEERRRNRRRRRRRTRRNCATKQPPYLWDKKIFQDRDNREQRLYRPDRRRLHHHQLSHHPDFEEPRRSTRSVSKPRHVEVLLVADKSMTDFHNESSLETYLLTIMNMVSSLYMDPSIGNYIKVVVVKIILVEEMQSSSGPGLSVSTNADTTLASFCKWQHQLNPDDDSNPHHHDVAILVTRKDICSLHDSPCSTLGVAHVAGMCKPDRSCSVNEDNGIMLAHTITHELGHNFGLYHDTEKIGCHRREGSTLHIMTPIFEADTVQVAWSRCSKRDVTNFLDTGSGECLGDTPSQEDYEYPSVPAGVIFDAEKQCHLQFGEESKVCAEPAELCEHLWCNVNNTCKTMLRPAAPGTTCGSNMWCQNMKCVARVPTPQPRDGGWGEWSEWSECSRTCGAGVQTKSRECNNPEPINSGKYCIGERSRYKICNTDACPIGEPSFREVQCHKKGNNGTEDWMPYFDQDKPCELLCSPMNGGPESEYGFVADGTPCRQTDGAKDMCIAGVCHKVGCDWIVDSDVKEDACGVCGGNGSTCNTVHGVYNKGTTKQTGFSEVAVIPAGSRNVRIEEKVNPVNFISIGSARSRRLYINGAHQHQPLTEYFVAGSQAIYERDRDWENVRIPGPIAEDLKVYQHISSKNRNPVVTYKYTVDRAPPQRRKFRYKFSEWSPCSVTCGGGYRRRHYQCVDERHRIVEQAQCYHIEQPRSDAMMEQCRRPPCPIESHLTHYWWTGQWGVCSRHCRMPGEESIKQRNVYCVDKMQNSIVNDSECPGTKPLTSIICADVPPC